MSLALCMATSWYGMFIRTWSSFKLLRSPEPVKEEDVRETLQFWTCFALLQLFDIYFEVFVSWIPLYSMAKFALLWYIITPSTRGASVVFENFIEPKFQERIVYMEKVFVVNFLGNLMHLGWIWEQVTLQLLADAGVGSPQVTSSSNLSLQEMEDLREKIEKILVLVENKIEERKSLPPPQLVNHHHLDEVTETRTVVVDLLHELDEEEFEPLNPPRSTPMSNRTGRSKTPSPQQESPQFMETTPPRSQQQQQHHRGSKASTGSSTSKSTHSQQPVFRPSHLPNRGVTSFVSSPTTTTTEEDLKDDQDVLLDELEEDEAKGSTSKPLLSSSFFEIATAPFAPQQPIDSTSKRMSALSVIRRFSGMVTSTPPATPPAVGTPNGGVVAVSAVSSYSQEAYDSLLDSPENKNAEEESAEAGGNSTASRLFSWVSSSPRWSFGWTTDADRAPTTTQPHHQYGTGNYKEGFSDDDDGDFVARTSGVMHTTTLRARTSSGSISNQENDGPVTRSRARRQIVRPHASNEEESSDGGVGRNGRKGKSKKNQS